MKVPGPATIPVAVGDCCVCPRLCRDVCPVAVHSFRDDFVPSEKMRAVSAAIGFSATPDVTERLMACTDCGACTDYCLFSVPVASWLSELRKANDAALTAYTVIPSPPPCAVIDAADLHPDAVLLSTCGGDPDTAREHVVAGGPNAPEDAPDPCLHRDDPAEKLAGGVERPEHTPPRGDTCCGERLRAGVGDSGLRQRMARAMVNGIADGTQVVVCDKRCGAHLQAAVGERLHVVALNGAAGDGEAGS